MKAIGEVRGRRVSVRTATRRPSSGEVEVECDVRVQDGWYLYAPGANDGLPVELRTLGGHSGLVELTGYPATADGHLSGAFTMSGSLAGPAVDWAELRVQACNGRTCEAPELLRLPLSATPTEVAP